MEIRDKHLTNAYLIQDDQQKETNRENMHSHIDTYILK